MTLSFAQRQLIGFQYVLDALAPRSPYGAERVRRLSPYAPGQEDALRAELHNVGRALAAYPACRTAWARLEQLMTQLKDITRSIDKCGRETLDEVELFEIKRFLLQLAELEPLYAALEAETGPLAGVSFADTLPALDLLDPEGNRVASFHLSARYSPELAAARHDKRRAEDGLRLAREPEARRVHEEARRDAVVREERAELAAREFLSEALGPHRLSMQENCAAIGRLDLILQKARLARVYGGCAPEIVARRVAFEGMIDPRTHDSLQADGKTFTPVSIALDEGTTVITGANMGGKSVALRAIALNVLAVSCGFFAFAARAEVCLFDSLHLIFEDMEDGGRGLSSFGGEVVRLNEALRAADQGYALMLLDELARGTNPHEGAAIARAVAAYLNARPVVCAMATHYDGVAGAAGAHYQVIGLRGADMEALGRAMAGLSGPGGVALIARHMNYGLFRAEGGQAMPRDALSICRLLGLRPEVLALAEDTAR